MEKSYKMQQRGITYHLDGKFVLNLVDNAKLKTKLTVQVVWAICLDKAPLLSSNVLELRLKLRMFNVPWKKNNKKLIGFGENIIDFAIWR